MHLTEVRERELQRSQIELDGGNNVEAVASEAEHTMKSMASIYSMTKLHDWHGHGLVCAWAPQGFPEEGEGKRI
jgi:hypothetical protein